MDVMCEKLYASERACVCARCVMWTTNSSVILTASRIKSCGDTPSLLTLATVEHAASRVRGWWCSCPNTVLRIGNEPRSITSGQFSAGGRKEEGRRARKRGAERGEASMR